MTDISDLSELKPRITVFGVGGAGGNAQWDGWPRRLSGSQTRP